jgi:Predicted Zn-dependent hydrolases of the beta-lactamase fold
VQVDGNRVLVDPVLFNAAPLGFINKSFDGVNIFKEEDIPPVDYLIITHSHWDHLDYKAIKN